MTPDPELIEKLERNARFYENEAAYLRPQNARNLGPEEMKCIGSLLREAIAALKGEAAAA